MPKKIYLSVSHTKIRKKADGQPVTGFSVKSFDLENNADVDALKQLFQERLYSTNAWGNPKPFDQKSGCTGSCNKNNYHGMYGIVIDIDEPGMTLEKARTEFQPFIHIIHTSSSHQVDKPDKGGKIDRFRVILPFEPNADGSPHFSKPADADKLFEYLKRRYSYADVSMYERGRKLYPFAGEDRSLYQFYYNADGKYIIFAPEEINAEMKTVPANIKRPVGRTQARRKPHDKGSNFYIKYNATTHEPYYSPAGEEYLMPDEVIRANVNNRWTDVPFQKLKEQMQLADIKKVTTFCNHCDDLISQSASAFIYVDFYGFFVMECTHCKSKKTAQYRWREYPVSSAMFSQNKKIYEIRIKSAEHIGPHEVSIEEWKSDAEAKFAIQVVKKKRFFLSSNFTINYYSDPEMSATMPTYQLDFPGNKIDIVYPIREPEVEENAFIDAYLDDVFGPYAEFIKNWLALYTYTNYQSLPVLVLAGGRGSGKNTFVQMVGDIFPMLWAQWTGDRERFNSYYTKKLLWIDENAFGDKRSQYDEIKYLTGNEYITVEEKYLPKYRVRNNTKVILTTNDFRPLAVKNEEAPASDKDNNFFFFELRSLDSEKRDRALGKKLSERIGYYCRTVLKARYEAIIASLDPRCRYMIPCPITEFSNRVYGMAKTEIEHIVDELTPMLAAKAEKYITYNELRSMLKEIGIVTSNANVKQYLTALQHRRILSIDEVRTKARRLGFEILVSSDIVNSMDEEEEGEMVDETLFNARIAG